MPESMGEGVVWANATENSPKTVPLWRARARAAAQHSAKGQYHFHDRGFGGFASRPRSPRYI